MITYVEIGIFLQSVIGAFSPFITYAFTLMIAFSVLYGIKRLITWGY